MRSRANLTRFFTIIENIIDIIICCLAVFFSTKNFSPSLKEGTLPCGFATKPVLDVGIEDLTQTSNVDYMIRYVGICVCFPRRYVYTHIYVYIYIMLHTYIYAYVKYLDYELNFSVGWAILKPTPTNCPTLYSHREASRETNLDRNPLGDICIPKLKQSEPLPIYKKNSSG